MEGKIIELKFVQTFFASLYAQIKLLPTFLNQITGRETQILLNVIMMHETLLYD